MATVDIKQMNGVVEPMDMKEPTQNNGEVIDDDQVDDTYHGQFTRNDRRDMARMGKAQELKVTTSPATQCC